ncbi:hypothetical protein [Parafrigoribacterium humi]|jgi:hypothetical protein|uniref:hypothetical protein n=1 Tax=Parafrigoribacterium humi TaxID=3144664 RepID=UPI0032EC570E
MSAVPVLKKILLWGGLLALVLVVAGSIVGYAVAGWTGVAGALIGTAMAVVFLAITALSILIATRYGLAVFFGIVMGAWILKFILFLVLVFLLKDQVWLQPTVMFVCLVVAVVGTLVVDVVVIARSRMPYVSDIALPGDGTGQSSPTPGTEPSDGAGSEQ